MQWVFIALVVLIVSILVTALQRIMNTVKKGLYIPPSEAIIDQSIPQEILEHIFSFMDPQTLLQSHNVSKYWRSHASKNHVKSIVLEQYVKSVQQELPGIENHWINYHETYPIDRRLSDIALAQKRGRKLIELQHKESPFFVVGSTPIWNELYIIKTFAALVATTYPVQFEFVIAGKNVRATNSLQIAPILSLKSGAFDTSIKYEAMLNLEDYCSNQAQSNLILFRNPRKEEKKRLGIIPLDSTFLTVMIFLIIPLIVHDVLYSESFINILKYWFGPIAFLVLNALVTIESWHMVRYYSNYRNVGLYKKLVISSSISAIIGFILLYPLSATHFAFIGLFGFTFMYSFLLYEHCVGEKWYLPKSKEKLHLFIICAALVLLTNDWSVTIRSMIDGTLWFRLFWNTIHFLFFLGYSLWVHIISLILQDRRKAWSWDKLKKWDRQAVNLMLGYYCSAVFVTLYAPNWQGNY